MSRATVDLPQPDSPTRPERLAFARSRGRRRRRPSAARAAAARARGRATAARRRTYRATSVELEQRRRAITRQRLGGASPSSAGRRVGARPGIEHRARSCRQRSIACAGSADGTRSRREWRSSRGIVPSICASRSRSSTIDGIEPIRPTVYGCARPVDHVGDRADLDDAARVHHGDAIGGLGDHAHVVRHQHHRGAVLAAQPLQQLDDLRLDRHVERGRRLVGDDEPRLRRERERDDDALAHAAGELVRIVVDPARGRRDADFLEQRDRALARRGSDRAAGACGSSRSAGGRSCTAD